MPDRRLLAMARAAAVVAGLALMGGCAASGVAGTRGRPVTLAELEWLIGTWRGGQEGEEASAFYETYRVRDDSTFVSVQFSDPACVPLSPATAALEERGGRVYQAFGPDRWVVVRESPTSLLLRPVDGGGVGFRWTSEGPARRTVTVLGGPGDGRTFTLHRLDADPTTGTPPCVPGAAGAPGPRGRPRP